MIEKLQSQGKLPPNVSNPQWIMKQGKYVIDLKLYDKYGFRLANASYESIDMDASVV